jgi:multiple sugar transport system permease protein
MGGRSVGRALHALGLLLVLGFAVFPSYWMVTSSLKEQTDLLASPPVWFFRPTLANYLDIFADQRVTTAVLNSMIVSTATTVLAVLLGTPAAYALARFEFRGKKDLWFWFISNRMISPIRSIPPDLEQSARLEGANQFDIFWRIYLPLGAPGVAVSAIFAFIFSWNELLYALVLITSQGLKTAPVVATNFMSGYELPWGKIMATGTIIVLPVTVFALVVSRHMVRGLTMGATK